MTFSGTPSLPDLEASALREIVRRAARAVGGAWTATWRLDGSLHVQDAARSGRISVSWSGVSLAPPKGQPASPEAEALARACRARLDGLRAVNPEIVAAAPRLEVAPTREAPRPVSDLRTRLAELAQGRQWSHYGVAFRPSDVEWSVEPAAGETAVSASVRGHLIGSFVIDARGRSVGVTGHTKRAWGYSDTKAPAALVEVAQALQEAA